MLELPNSEERITFNIGDEELVGIYCAPADEDRPDSENPSRAPAVVFLHGFTSNRMEDPIFRLHEGMFDRAAWAFARRGFASLRFDFRSHGESDGAFEDLTLSRLIEDTLAAVEFIQGQAEVDRDRICLLGHSLGTVAAVCASHRNSGIRALGLWHALPYPYHTFVELLGAATVERTLEEGRTTFMWEDKGRFALRSRFFEELLELSPLTEIAQFTGSAFFIYGSDDPYIQPQPWVANAFENAHQGLHQTLHMATDHTFSVRTRGAKVLDRAIEATIAAFEVALEMTPQRQENND